MKLHSRSFKSVFGKPKNRFGNWSRPELLRITTIGTWMAIERLQGRLYIHVAVTCCIPKDVIGQTQDVEASR